MEKFTVGEPWKTDATGNQHAITNKRGYDVCYMNFYLAKERQIAYASHIVDCVNGCAGIRNPLAVGKVVEALKMAIEALRDNNIDEMMAGEFEILTDALTHIEGIKS